MTVSTYLPPNMLIYPSAKRKPGHAIALVMHRINNGEVSDTCRIQHAPLSGEYKWTDYMFSLAHLTEDGRLYAIAAFNTDVPVEDMEFDKLSHDVNLLIKGVIDEIAECIIDEIKACVHS